MYDMLPDHIKSIEEKVHSLYSIECCGAGYIACCGNYEHKVINDVELEQYYIVLKELYSLATEHNDVAGYN